jgi:hypothetical protein
MLHPALRVVGRVVDHAGANGGAAAEMRQVRADPPLRGRALDRVAVHARIAFEDLLALARQVGRRGCGRLLLLAHPGVELVARFGHHADTHPGVLGAAVLGAGTLERARLVHPHPHGVGLARISVRLPAELGNPETVDHVRAGDLQLARLAAW